MKVSVITVCFNSADTIVDTMRSLATQTHRQIEHIVVDGGSTDGTLDLVRRHAITGCRIFSGPDKGIYDAMNKGLRLSTGAIVGFLNSDDTFAAPDVVARIAAVVDAEAADAVYGDLTYIDPTRARPLVRYWRAGEFRTSRLRHGWMPPHPTFYVGRKLLDSVGEFDSSMKVAADYEFMIRCLTRPELRVAYLRAVLVRMRIGGASNRSITALLRKSREDLAVMHRYRIGGVLTLLLKNLQKIPQLLRSEPTGAN